ncbi:MAG: diadenylate cyclase CdaA [Elusimicrobiota bacterium]
MEIENTMQIIKQFGAICVQALDVLIVTYIFYRAYLLIKHSRALLMLRGIIVLFVFTVISQVFNFTIVEWLLRSLWAVALIAAVIIFQPEIRSALAAVGRGRFSAIRICSESMERIIAAVTAFSLRRTGAIIVLEREIGLKGYIDQGVIMEAEVSTELLESIFMMYAPLHDGAVIIKHDKIASAASFLPLTKREDLPKTVGTRHRAALGITEVSDAIVIVVSEETGQVSIVENGDITWNVGLKELKRELRKCYEEHEVNFLKWSRRIWSEENLKKNLNAKIVSIALALLLWYYVKYS